LRRHVGTSPHVIRMFGGNVNHFKNFLKLTLKSYRYPKRILVARRHVGTSARRHVASYCFDLWRKSQSFIKHITTILEVKQHKKRMTPKTLQGRWQPDPPSCAF